MKTVNVGRDETDKNNGRVANFRSAFLFYLTINLFFLLVNRFTLINPLLGEMLSIIDLFIMLQINFRTFSALYQRMSSEDMCQVNHKHFIHALNTHVSENTNPFHQYLSSFYID